MPATAGMPEGGSGAGASAPDGIAGSSGAGGVAGSEAPSEAGSGGSSGPSENETPPAREIVGTGSTSGDAKRLTAKLTISQVPPGEQSHQCVVVELPNTEAKWVSELHATLSDGSHHLIVDRLDAQDEVFTEAADCSPTIASDQTRLMLVQQRDTRLKLPKGVAFQIEARQRIFLQLHYINLGEKPEDVTGEVELLFADTIQRPKLARSLFTGSFSVSIPAHQSSATRYFYEPATQGQVLHVFALTSHTHRLGIRTTIERVSDLDAPEAKPLHEALDWAEPPLNQFDPPLDFSGKDGLRLTCRYMNTTDQDVGIGARAEDEMCNMWLYYFDE